MLDFYSFKSCCSPLTFSHAPSSELGFGLGGLQLGLGRVRRDRLAHRDGSDRDPGGKSETKRKGTKHDQLPPIELELRVCGVPTLSRTFKGAAPRVREEVSRSKHSANNVIPLALRPWGRGHLRGSAPLLPSPRLPSGDPSPSPRP